MLCSGISCHGTCATRHVVETFPVSELTRLQDDDSLIDCEGAQEEPEGGPGGRERGKRAKGDS